jgi:hypothetical protein
MCDLFGRLQMGLDAVKDFELEGLRKFQPDYGALENEPLLEVRTRATL